MTRLAMLRYVTLAALFGTALSTASVSECVGRTVGGTIHPAHYCPGDTASTGTCYNADTADTDCTACTGKTGTGATTSYTNAAGTTVHVATCEVPTSTNCAVTAAGGTPQTYFCAAKSQCLTACAGAANCGTTSIDTSNALVSPTTYECQDISPTSCQYNVAAAKYYCKVGEAAAACITGCEPGAANHAYLTGTDGCQTGCEGTSTSACLRQHAPDTRDGVKQCTSASASLCTANNKQWCPFSPYLHNEAEAGLWGGVGNTGECVDACTGSSPTCNPGDTGNGVALVLYPVALDGRCQKPSPSVCLAKSNTPYCADGTGSCSTATCAGCGTNRVVDKTENGEMTCVDPGKASCTKNGKVYCTDGANRCLDSCDACGTTVNFGGECQAATEALCGTLADTPSLCGVTNKCVANCADCTGRTVRVLGGNAVAGTGSGECTVPDLAKCTAVSMKFCAGATPKCVSSCADCAGREMENAGNANQCDAPTDTYCAAKSPAMKLCSNKCIADCKNCAGNNVLMETAGNLNTCSTPTEARCALASNGAGQYCPDQATCLPNGSCKLCVTSGLLGNGLAKATPVHKCVAMERSMCAAGEYFCDAGTPRCLKQGCQQCFSDGTNKRARDTSESDATITSNNNVFNCVAASAANCPKQITAAVTGPHLVYCDLTSSCMDSCKECRDTTQTNSDLTAKSATPDKLTAAGAVKAELACFRPTSADQCFVNAAGDNNYNSYSAAGFCAANPGLGCGNCKACDGGKNFVVALKARQATPKAVAHNAVLAGQTFTGECTAATAEICDTLGQIFCPAATGSTCVDSCADCSGLPLAGFTAGDRVSNAGAGVAPKSQTCYVVGEEGCAMAGKKYCSVTQTCLDSCATCTGMTMEYMARVGSSTSAVPTGVPPAKVALCPEGNVCALTAAQEYYHVTKASVSEADCETACKNNVKCSAFASNPDQECRLYGDGITETGYTLAAATSTAMNKKGPMVCKAEARFKCFHLQSTFPASGFSSADQKLYMVGPTFNKCTAADDASCKALGRKFNAGTNQCSMDSTCGYDKKCAANQICGIASGAAYRSFKKTTATTTAECKAFCDSAAECIAITSKEGAQCYVHGNAKLEKPDAAFANVDAAVADNVNAASAIEGCATGATGDQCYVKQGGKVMAPTANALVGTANTCLNPQAAATDLAGADAAEGSVNAVEANCARLGYKSCSNADQTVSRCVADCTPAECANQPAIGRAACAASADAAAATAACTANGQSACKDNAGALTCVAEACGAANCAAYPNTAVAGVCAKPTANTECTGTNKFYCATTNKEQCVSACKTACPNTNGLVNTFKDPAADQQDCIAYTAMAECDAAEFFCDVAGIKACMSDCSKCTDFTVRPAAGQNNCLTTTPANAAACPQADDYFCELAAGNKCVKDCAECAKLGGGGRMDGAAADAMTCAAATDANCPAAQPCFCPAAGNVAASCTADCKPCASETVCAGQTLHTPPKFFCPATSKCIADCTATDACTGFANKATPAAASGTCRAVSSAVCVANDKSFCPANGAAGTAAKCITKSTCATNCLGFLDPQTSPGQCELPSVAACTRGSNNFCPATAQNQKVACTSDCTCGDSGAFTMVKPLDNAGAQVSTGACVAAAEPTCKADGKKYCPLLKACVAACTTCKNAMEGSLHLDTDAFTCRAQTAADCTAGTAFCAKSKTCVSDCADCNMVAPPMVAGPVYVMTPPDTNGRSTCVAPSAETCARPAPGREFCPAVQPKLVANTLAPTSTGSAVSACDVRRKWKATGTDLSDVTCNTDGSALGQAGSQDQCAEKAIGAGKLYFTYNPTTKDCAAEDTVTACSKFTASGTGVTCTGSTTVPGGAVTSVEACARAASAAIAAGTLGTDAWTTFTYNTGNNACKFGACTATTAEANTNLYTLQEYMVKATGTTMRAVGLSGAREDKSLEATFKDTAANSDCGAAGATTVAGPTTKDQCKYAAQSSGMFGYAFTSTGPVCKVYATCAERPNQAGWSGGFVAATPEWLALATGCEEATAIAYTENLEQCLAKASTGGYAFAVFNPTTLACQGSAVCANGGGLAGGKNYKLRSACGCGTGSEGLDGAVGTNNYVTTTDGTCEIPSRSSCTLNNDVATRTFCPFNINAAAAARPVQDWVYLSRVKCIKQCAPTMADSATECAATALGSPMTPLPKFWFFNSKTKECENSAIAPYVQKTVPATAAAAKQMCADNIACADAEGNALRSVTKTGSNFAECATTAMGMASAVSYSFNTGDNSCNVYTETGAAPAGFTVSNAAAIGKGFGCGAAAATTKCYAGPASRVVGSVFMCRDPTKDARWNLVRQAFDSNGALTGGVSSITINAGGKSNQKSVNCRLVPLTGVEKYSVKAEGDTPTWVELTHAIADTTAAQQSDVAAHLMSRPSKSGIGGFPCANLQGAVPQPADQVLIETEPADIISVRNAQPSEGLFFDYTFAPTAAVTEDKTVTIKVYLLGKDKSADSKVLAGQQTVIVKKDPSEICQLQGASVVTPSETATPATTCAQGAAWEDSRGCFCLKGRCENNACTSVLANTCPETEEKAVATGPSSKFTLGCGAGKKPKLNVEIPDPSSSGEQSVDINGEAGAELELKMNVVGTSTDTAIINLGQAAGDALIVKWDAGATSSDISELTRPVTIYLCNVKLHLSGNFEFSHNVELKPSTDEGCADSLVTLGRSDQTIPTKFTSKAGSGELIITELKTVVAKGAKVQNLASDGSQKPMKSTGKKLGNGQCDPNDQSEMTGGEGGLEAVSLDCVDFKFKPSTTNRAIKQLAIKSSKYIADALATLANAAAPSWPQVEELCLDDSVEFDLSSLEDSSALTCTGDSCTAINLVEYTSVSAACANGLNFNAVPSLSSAVSGNYNCKVQNTANRRTGGKIQAVFSPRSTTTTTGASTTSTTGASTTGASTTAPTTSSPSAPAEPVTADDGALSGGAIGGIVAAGVILVLVVIIALAVLAKSGVIGGGASGGAASAKALEAGSIPAYSQVAYTPASYPAYPVATATPTGPSPTPAVSPQPLVGTQFAAV